MEQAFISLNNSMCSTPILTVLDFTKPFVLECDVSGTNLGEVLTQEGRPLTFTSKQLCDRNLGKSTYEKEIMVIFHAVDTWQPPLNNTNGSPKCWVMIMKSFIKRGSIMYLQMHYLTNMMMKGPC